MRLQWRSVSAAANVAAFSFVSTLQGHARGWDFARAAARGQGALLCQLMLPESQEQCSTANKMLYPLCVSHLWCNCLQAGDASVNLSGASAIQPGESCMRHLSLLHICWRSTICRLCPSRDLRHDSGVPAKPAVADAMMKEQVAATNKSLPKHEPARLPHSHPSLPALEPADGSSNLLGSRQEVQA